MMHVGYKFDIAREGLLLSDVDTALEPHSQVNIDNTPLNIGDTFVLELDQNGCMFFKKSAA
ncbi:MAG: hypothetical protein ACKVJK_01955 [Methylophagaceae bacterium]|jgi:hypothetical protein|tara:strand:- start:1158 stop:1340 length:183 start_codon:yes stop_codon:yes gene_type:complete